jgi:putative membrane protein
MNGLHQQNSRHEIEEPIGISPNDLPLDAICRTIEIDLRESIHDKKIPPTLLPVNFRVM